MVSGVPRNQAPSAPAGQETGRVDAPAEDADAFADQGIGAEDVGEAHDRGLVRAEHAGLERAGRATSGPAVARAGGRQG